MKQAIKSVLWNFTQ